MRVILAWAIVAAVGCGTDAISPPPPPHDNPSQPDNRAVAGPSAVADTGYEVGIEAPEHAEAGKPAIAKVSVHPHAPWHMNADFPAKLRMSASEGVDLDAVLLTKNDAERLDDEGLVFPVVFTPRIGHTGRVTLTGEINFAVCGVAECSPVKVPIEFTLEITREIT
ncbi:MAG: hypothetical protein JKY37_26710 [Nannocystaceae bacterium]|nr:hypothetical protein [Nannocystaceae bacterium]